MRKHNVALPFAVASALVLGACTSSSATPTASPAVTPAAATCSEQGTNPPGTYDLTAADTFTVPATITLAESGWKGCGLLTKEYGPPAGLALIAFWHVENVYANPCHWMGALMDPPAGPSAAELTTALAAQDITEASEPGSDTLGGYPASFVRLSVATDFDGTDCGVAVEDPEFRFWKDAGEELTGSAVWWVGAKDAAGLIGEVWAADIDDVRVVVQAAYYTDSARAEVDEIHQIVESIVLSR